MIEEILHAGNLAPSSKNRQPWRFIVVTGNAKREMLDVMRNGLKREAEKPLLPDSVCYRGSAEFTLKIMEQASVTVFVINPLGTDIHESLTPEQRVYEICNNQSIGAAMENMTLAATELGLGSLWICDTFFAYDELHKWLDTEGAIAGAMTIGYADETPHARPRKNLCDITEWRE